MRYMQIIKARNVEAARSSYLQMLSTRGIALAPHSAVYVETVHRPRADSHTWLCYVAPPQQQRAA